MADNYNYIEIIDSEDDDSRSIDHLRRYTDMADDTSESDGRLSPFIQRSIRRSLDNFDHDSPDELSSDEDFHWYGVPESDGDISDESIPTSSRAVEAFDAFGIGLDDSDQAMAVEVANEEANNSGAAALTAQKKAYLEIQRDHMEQKIAKSKIIYNEGNIEALPDGGERIRLSIMQDELQLQDIMKELHDLQAANYVVVSDPKKTLFKEGSMDIDPQYLQPTTVKVERDFGVKAEKTFDHQQTPFNQGSLEIDPQYLQPTTVKVERDFGVKAEKTFNHQQTPFKEGSLDIDTQYLQPTTVKVERDFGVKAEKTFDPQQTLNKTLFKEGSLDIDPQYLQPTTVKVERDFGVKAEKTFDPQQTLNKTLFKEGSLDIDPQYLQPTTDKVERGFGVKAQRTFDHQQGLTVERLKDLHGSLLNKPPEEHRAEDPKGLKVKLMAHQKYALTWLLWREKQNPPGGLLADDMGLGKTLTMIALIMACMKDPAEQKPQGEWISNARQQRYLGGTLVVAPASLVAQWASEVKNRCESGLLVVELYHGNNRERNPQRLARNDIVLTTYNILSRADKENGVLYKIHWKRVILDEAHIIRNHKSYGCEAVCALYAYKRWVLTGTPVQNKEMDLFAIMKFLKCSPFDDLRVWKRWVDNRNSAGQERLATLMKGIMLRRTKQELQSSGAIESLTEKLIEEIEVELDPEERLVYDKVMVYSRTLFAQFLTQRAEKQHMFEMGAGKYYKPSWQSTNSKSQFTRAQDKLLALHADVQSFQILVLILRLRQICCHPSLIHSMLDREDIETNELENVKYTDTMVDQMNNVSMDDAEGEGEVGVDERVSQHLLTSDNPVFDKNRRSSKMRMIIQKVEDIMETGDKSIVVSQWVSVLEIIARELDSIKGIKYSRFTGKVLVKDRQGVLDDFNSPHSRTNVLLLSLTAGGIGLNLVGANHLLLVDIHWNPQLECQAQDRIYRFGQKKDVFIYKYICSDTIEERIKALQEKKLKIASNLLSGKGGGSKLTLDEMKLLFSL